MSERKHVDVFVIVVEDHITKSFAVKDMIFDDKLSLVDISLLIDGQIRDMDA